MSFGAEGASRATLPRAASRKCELCWLQVRPNVGAIPPMSELQALWWIAKLQGKLTGPKSGDDYKLVDREARRLEFVTALCLGDFCAP